MHKALLKKTIRAVLREKLMKRKTPFISAFEILYRCNLLCEFCRIPLNKKYEMTTDELKTAIREFSEAGMGIAIFTGGEPTLRDDLGELINYTKSFGVFTHLVTNGTYLSKRINLVKDVDSLSISIDGPKEIHDKLRGPGVFDRAMEGLKTAKEHGTFVHLMSIITQDNVKNDGEGIKQLIDISRKHDVMINFQPIYSDQYNKLDLAKVFPQRDELIHAIEMIEQYKKETGNVMASFAYLRALKNIDKIKWSCKAGQLYSFVFPDGKVAPCYFKENSTMNGLEHGFINAFNKLPSINENGGCCKRLCHGYREYNLVFDMNFQSLANALKNLVMH